MKVVCVLRSGGDYTPQYVLALQHGVKKHLRLEHRFICLTDDAEWAGDLTLAKIETRPLLYDWPAWWAKVNAFSIMGPCLYLDLDTVVIGDITDLCAYIYELKALELLSLRSFRKNTIASGIMGWRNDWSWLTRRLKEQPGKEFQKLSKATRLHVDGKTYNGDQDWLQDQLMTQGVTPILIQSKWPYVGSYKHHCCQSLPEGVRMVCFHGRPRPHEIEPKPEWMKEYWA